MLASLTDMLRDAIQALAACLDPGQLLSDADLMAPYLREIGARENGAALAVSRPSTTEQVPAIVNTCAAREIAIVPQGHLGVASTFTTPRS